MQLLRVNANQAAILTRVGGAFCLLLTTEATTLGRRVIFMLERAWRAESLYVFALPTVPTASDLPYIRQLGITQLPEVRRYEQGRLIARYTGLREIERFATHEVKA
jgi:hypothetical protein